MVIQRGYQKKKVIQRHSIYKVCSFYNFKILDFFKIMIILDLSLFSLRLIYTQISQIAFKMHWNKILDKFG